MLAADGGGGDWKGGLSMPKKDERFKTTDVTDTRGQEFEAYFLKRELLMGIFEKGFERPSPVQERSIPIILQNRNVLARAKNGTGKTAAFIIPCLEKTDTAKNFIQGNNTTHKTNSRSSQTAWRPFSSRPSSLIAQILSVSLTPLFVSLRGEVLMLVPTRELALQTSSVVRELGKHMSIQCMVSTGGTSLKDDIMRLYNTVHILVGTPGRILDLASKGVAKLSQCKTVIMDEADKLLSTEFQPLLEQLINSCAPNRQICLFSATFPVTVKSFKDKFIQNPYEINLMDDLTLKGITQYYAFVKERQKVHCLNTLFTKVKTASPLLSLFSRVLFLLSCVSPLALTFLLRLLRFFPRSPRTPAGDQSIRYLLQLGESR